MQFVDRIGVILLWTLGTAALMVGCGTSPPTVPENLVVEATSDATINVSWDESTDYGDVEGYRVYRNGEKVAKLRGTEFLDSGLENSTEYCYRVSAYDGEDNRSDKSEKECDTTWATPTDTLVPTTPTDLVATILDSTISLTWTESTDDTSVERYDVYHGEDTIANAVYLGSSVTNSYSHVGLDTSIVHCYIVNAVDGFGNQSNSSETVCTNP